MINNTLNFQEEFSTKIPTFVLLVLFFFFRLPYLESFHKVYA
jgi:hypothetical protein